MFDLDINNYSKNELEGLLDLSNKNYTREDVEKSTTTLQGQIKSNNTVDDATRDKTSLFLITVKDALAGFMESRDYDQFLPDPTIQNQNHFVMSKPIHDVNPMKRNNITRVVNIDSLFRANMGSSSPSKFSINLTNPINKTVGMELSMFEPPSTIFNISDKLGNNYFHLEATGGALTKVSIPDGSYSTTSEILVQLEIDSNVTSATIESNKLKIVFTGIFEKAKFDLDITGCSSSGTFPQRLGYIMGFRTPTVDLDLVGSYITSTGSPCLKVSNYFFLSVNDFQQNVSSNFLSSCDDQKIPTNTLARVSIDDLSRIVIFNGGENNASPERKYFGPCDIGRLDIELVDKFGRTIDTGNTDFSFAITFKCAYD
jgi:hypothetical protein